MSKTKELNKIKEEVNSVNEKLRELTEEELEQVSGGGDHYCPGPGPGNVCNMPFKGEHCGYCSANK